MKFLAIEKENIGVKSDQLKPYLKEEALKVLELYERDIIREIYFDQFHNAVIILESTNILEAKKELNKLPLVSNDLISFEIRELNPYTGYSRIIG
jgi:hypothetical protein